MKTYTQFLDEDISIQDGKLSFSYNTKEDETSISTKMGKGKFIPYIKKSASVAGVSIYSAYKLSGSSATTILKALKRKNSISVNDVDYKQFLSRSSLFVVSKILKSIKPDYIVLPQTSSPFLSDIAEALKSRLPGVILIKDTFQKVNPAEIRVDTSKLDDIAKKNIDSIIKKAQQIGYLEAKKIPKKFLSLFSGFFNISNKVDANKFTGKNIVLLDDVLGSGFSMSEMIKSLQVVAPNSITGVTLFKTA